MQRDISTLLKTWTFLSAIVAWVLAFVMLVKGAVVWAAVCAVYAVGADIAGRRWSRRSPVPMPYFMRWLLLLPRGPHSPARLGRILRPRSGEHVLEVGPGLGVHALPMASLLLPNGRLDALDVQREMLDDLALRAAKKGVTNIVLKQGDARRLPYPDATFDAAYLVGVLGEIPDTALALRELRRVLKPTARLVISELAIDPDFIRLPTLLTRARDAGFAFERSAGPRFAYSAVFRPASIQGQAQGKVMPS